MPVHTRIGCCEIHLRAAVRSLGLELDARPEDPDLGSGLWVARLCRGDSAGPWGPAAPHPLHAALEALARDMRGVLLLWPVDERGEA